MRGDLLVKLATEEQGGKEFESLAAPSWSGLTPAFLCRVFDNREGQEGEGQQGGFKERPLQSLKSMASEPL